MPMPSRPLFLLTLLACAGCTQASDASVARRDHLLAGPHGWIDITLHAPAGASSKPAASAPVASPDCLLAFVVNGETMMQESGDLAQADAARNPLGYRFIVPAGELSTRLAILNCVKEPLSLPLSLTLERNHLALLEFDGRKLVSASTQAYEPATLDAVHDDVARLHTHGAATDGTLSTLTKLVIASLVLNFVVIVVALTRRNR